MVVETVNILIYGEPGTGKTSLVNTSKSPLTLDFDKGVHRSDFRKDVLVIESWKQFNDNMAELIKSPLFFCDKGLSLKLFRYKIK